MRKIKILFFCIVIIAIVAIIKYNEAKAENLIEQYNNTNIVQYGKEIKLQENGKYVSNNPEIATIISDNVLRVSGVGHFTITRENNETLNFFSWNAFLKDGKYYTYNDEKKKSKSEILYSKVYLAVTETSNKEALKIEDYFLAKGGKYKGDLNGKYITSYYNSKTGKSDTKYFEYSFEKKISKIMPTAIELDKNNITLKLRETEKLNVIKIEPKEVDDNTVTFESNDTNIAEVNKETGVILGVGEGHTKIIAKTNNGIIAECKVKVVKETSQSIPQNKTTEEKSGRSSSSEKEKNNSNNKTADELQKDITVLNDEIKQLRNELDELQKNINIFKKNAEVFRKSDKKMASSYDYSVQVNEERYKETLKKYMEKVGEVFKKESELSKINKEEEDKETKNSNEKSTKQNNSKTVDNEQKQETIIDLRVKLLKLETEENELNKKLVNLESNPIYFGALEMRDKETADVKKEIENVKKEKKELDQKIASKEIENEEKSILELEKEHEFCQKQISKLEDEKRALEDEKSILEEKHNKKLIGDKEYKKTKNDIDNAISEKDKTIDIIIGECFEYNKLIRQKEKQKQEEIKQKQEKLKKEKEELAPVIEKAKEKVKEKVENNSNLKKTKDTISKTISSANETVNKIKSTIKNTIIDPIKNVFNALFTKK